MFVLFLQCWWIWPVVALLGLAAECFGIDWASGKELKWFGVIVMLSMLLGARMLD